MKWGTRDRPKIDRIACPWLLSRFTGREPELCGEAAGLVAVSQGLSFNFANDHEMLKHRMVVCDALYAWRGGTPVKEVPRFQGVP